MRWTEVVTHLTNARALWQDLDGVHVGPLPENAPHTSILWAWACDGGNWAARVRIDADDVAYLHRITWPSESENQLEPVSTRDGVHAVRGPGAARIATGFWAVDVDGVSFVREEPA